MVIQQLLVLRENIIPFVPKPMGVLGQLVGEKGINKNKTALDGE